MKVEYRCVDGATLPVVFDRAEDAAIEWALDREHMPNPLTPMADALNRVGDPGSLRAYEEVGMVRPASFRPGPDAMGVAYFSREPMTEAELAILFEGGRALVERYGSALGIWQEYCMPLVRADCDALARAGADVPLATLAERQAHCLHVTMIPAFVGGHDVQQLTAVLTDAYGDDAPLVAHELTQGYESQTLRADSELWRLGRLAAGSTDLMAALDAGEPAASMAALRAGGGQARFFAALDEFLAEFGRRSEGWEIGFPTWEEQRDGFWSQLRHLAAADVADPADVVRRGAARRAERAAEVEGRLAGDAEAVARFRRRLERVATYVAVREDRAHWQLVSVGALRAAVLRRGAALAAEDVLDTAEDVLYLHPEEVEVASGQRGDLQPVVAERRATHERWMRVRVPSVIGGSTQPGGGGTKAGTAGTADVLVRGVGASRGVVTAPARIVRDLADADRLQPGDVLVCVMTAPPWTPLFQVASAVVADSGDIGSHVAIAAREYGIPCVLGTGTGTTVLRDDQVIIVDGTAGVVRMAGSGSSDRLGGHGG